MTQYFWQKNDRDIERIAFDFIRTKYGNLPYPGKPIFKENVWIVPINIRYPRILFDEIKKIPKKVRFMQEKRVGELIISPENYQIIKKPTYFELRRTILEHLESIRISVEKALVKVAAKNFSKLPLPIHMNTPIVDVLSYLLVKDSFNMKEELERLPRDDVEKYLNHINSLKAVGLVDIINNVVYPGDYLIQVEKMGGKLKDKLQRALTIFFSRGYEFIERIREVLGIHLVISGIFYEASIEYEEMIPFKSSTIERIILDMPQYRLEKKIKIPRYLAQLEEIDILDETTIDGETAWVGNNEIMKKIYSEPELITDIMKKI